MPTRTSSRSVTSPRMRTYLSLIGDLALGQQQFQRRAVGALLQPPDDPRRLVLVQLIGRVQVIALGQDRRDPQPGLPVVGAVRVVTEPLEMLMDDAALPAAGLRGRPVIRPGSRTASRGSVRYCRAGVAGLPRRVRRGGLRLSCGGGVLVHDLGVVDV